MSGQPTAVPPPVPGRRVALVPAASQGLGLACAHALARSGATVAMCSRRPDRIRAAADQVAATTGATVLAAAVDLTSAEAISAWVAEVTATAGPPLILVANAGGPPPATAAGSTDDDFAGAFDLVFYSAIRLIRAVLPGMRAAGWGRIVSLSSYSARQPVPSLGPSAAARGALLGVLKLLAAETGPDGITVNTVLTGPTATDRITELAAAQAAQSGEDVAARLATLGAAAVLRRLGEPDEIAALTAFLCSPDASFITGAAIPADGGAIASI
jgi:3-oxoacyl-[acyl-carrier protein] reductase